MRNFFRSIAVGGAVLLLAASADITPAASGAEPQAAATQSRPDAQPPEQPRTAVDVPDIAVTGRTLRVPAGGDLQKALDESVGGDLIALAPGATFRGPFRLRKKEGAGWIVISSAAMDLPRPGRHVRPSDAPRMAKLVASSGPVLTTEPGAHHYRFVGLEIAPTQGDALHTLVQLGNDDTSLETLPHHIIFDRCYLHGDARRGTRRGIAMNSRDTAVVDSYLADFKDTSADSQAISAWNGPGPFRIANNYLEGAGENVMFGGGDPTIRDLVPGDIEIVRNHFAKPLRWKVGHATYEGVEWSVKNLFELKNARRVLVDGNLFEYNWPHAQNGFAILFTVRNQDGGAPWSVVEDVTFRNNVIRHVAAGINVLGRDDIQKSQQTQRIAIHNNVFVDVGGTWGNGRLFQLLDGTRDVSIAHNTAFQTGSILFGGDNAAHTGFVFQNNITPHNEHGITGSGTAIGTASLQRFFPQAVVTGNVIVGGKPGDYPRDNFFPASMEALGVVAAREPVQITLVRPFAGGGTGGRNPGADLDAVAKALGAIAPIALQNRASADETSAPGIGLSTGAAWTFWTAFALIGYVYFGYPLIAWLRALWRPRLPQRGRIEPFVSVVVIAHNEASRIDARIENLLLLDYPRDRFEIVIASDGSTDDTVARARAYEDAGVIVRPYSERRGKAAVLNAVVPTVCGDVVLFADARQRFARGTLRALVDNFADKTVGAVSGELIIAAGDGIAVAGQGTAFYWRYEKLIRASESRAGSTICATGAIYAIRRELFEPIPNDTILDDVLIPLQIVRRGFRVLFEPAARAYDYASATARQEFARKARTNAGLFQLLSRETWLLNPRANRLWFETVSHKALRLALPVLHVTLLLATVPLASGVFYRWALAGQVMFYAAALLGYTQRQAQRRSFVISVPCAICLLSWAVAVGFWRFITNRQQVTWERVATAPAAPGWTPGSTTR